MKVLILTSSAADPTPLFKGEPRGRIVDTLDASGDHWIRRTENSIGYGGEGHQAFKDLGPNADGGLDHSRLVDAEPIDWVISFGWRKILKPDFIAKFPNRIINIHISLLPWNRGADPNFWSWYDNTPKGVSIHQITPGLDTGPIIAQMRVPLENTHTLRSSYDVLMSHAVALFADKWPLIREDRLVANIQSGPSTYHRQADKDKLFKLLGYGYDSPCSAVERLKELTAA